MGNTGRCGSTLLAQCFDKTGIVKCFSEPGAFKSMIGINDTIDNADIQLKCRSIGNVLCKPDQSTKRRNTHFFFKLEMFTSIFISHLSHVYPNAHFLFMYRDGLSVAQSITKIIKVSPLLRLKELFMMISNKLRHLKIKQAIAIMEDIQVESRLQLGFIIWAYAMRMYNDFRIQGELLMALSVWLCY